MPPTSHWYSLHIIYDGKFNLMCDISHLYHLYGDALSADKVAACALVSVWEY